MRHFTSVQDVDNLSDLVAQAIAIKTNPFSTPQLGQGRTLGLVFFNSSLRTRLSTQRAAINLGLSTIVMNVSTDSWQLEFEDGAVMNGGKAEHIKEAAAVIGQYCDVIGIRAFSGLVDRNADYQEEVLTSFIQYSGVPIVSLESATRHPLQSLADIVTIETNKTVARPKVVLSWAPHPRALPQAVGNSFAEWMNIADVDLVITNPEGYDLAPEFVGDAPVIHDQKAAFEGADFIYTKNWSSYEDYGKILRTDDAWMISPDKMAVTNNAKFMHCLPVRRNVVVADAVIDSANSLVIEQAGNRVVSAQTVLTNILKTL